MAGKELAALGVDFDLKAAAVAIFIIETGKLLDAFTNEAALHEAARKRVALLRSEIAADKLLAPEGAHKIMRLAASIIEGWLRERRFAYQNDNRN